MLASGEVQQVLAWKKGDFPCYPEPAFFAKPEDLQDMVYDKFCSANLSKYMAKNDIKRTLVFLRPCDAYGFNQLLKENQIKRESAYIIGVGCDGCVAVDEGQELGLLEACRVCTKTTFPVYDELIEAEAATRQAADKDLRFAEVNRLEALAPAERYAFWRQQLSESKNVCYESLGSKPKPWKFTDFNWAGLWRISSECLYE